MCPIRALLLVGTVCFFQKEKKKRKKRKEKVFFFFFNFHPQKSSLREMKVVVLWHEKTTPHSNSFNFPSKRILTHLTSTFLLKTTTKPHIPLSLSLTIPNIHTNKKKNPLRIIIIIIIPFV